MSIALGLLLVSACRGHEASPPRDSAPPAAADARASAPATPAADADADADATASAAPDTVAPDHAGVLAAVLDHPPFSQYLHPDAPGRVPVVVTGIDTPDPLGLERFGEPVVVRSAHAGSGPVVQFTRWSVDGDAADVRLNYAVEGVVASFTLARTGGAWSVTSAEIAEH
jgi:hypothetical protein